MSNIIEIQQFLVGKRFVIPHYQRDYAWSLKQVEDLIDDVSEAVTSGSTHYLGTVVLARNDIGPYEVVDGQQRLSTLAVIIQALLLQLPQDDDQRIADTAVLLKHGSELKLHFGNNAEFASLLLSENQPEPETAGQRKLQAAFEYACERARALAEGGGVDLVREWINTIKVLEIIEFVATNTGRAIRMFQTVNDRGLPLSAMDKAKALLVYYSNRYLDGELDIMVNESIGRCFAAFDDVREHVKKGAMKIDNVARDAFSEDDMLRYHYLSYKYPGIEEGGDWDGTISTVFHRFLKGTLKSFSSDSGAIREFIIDYCSDLADFCESFRELVLLTETNTRLYKYFVVLGVSARLYPLTVRLMQRNILFSVPEGESVDLLQLLEICDVRVYKTRGTDPAKGIGMLSHESRDATVDELRRGLREFTARFMPDGYFYTMLHQNVYHNQALPFIMLEFDESCAKREYTVDELRDLIEQQITREHILSQTPNFDVTTYNFEGVDDFELHKDFLGNFTPLTKSENARCSNSNVHTKMTDHTMYSASRYASTRMLAQEYRVNEPRFRKNELIIRTERMASWIINRWSL
ncbi:MAG TPA: DUF262 domain-containing protein [Bacteroidota bacterium]|nr:DUF262 domain-containing protein [Bacteroidota bacterium]